jgi:hypothetical protein
MIMGSKPMSAVVAHALLALTVLLTAPNWYFQPERRAAWVAALVFVGAMALALRVARRRQRDGAAGYGETIRGVVFGALILIVSLVMRLIVQLGGLDDPDVTRRATMVFTGAFFVFSGNAMPKRLAPLSGQCDGARTQAFQRFVGWTWVLMGGAFSLAWLVLPVDVAKPVSVAMIMAGVAAVATQMARLRWARHRPA